MTHRMAESMRKDPGQFRFDITVIRDQPVASAAGPTSDRETILTLDAGVTIARSRAEVALGDLYETLKELPAAAAQPVPDTSRIAAGLERLASLPVVPSVLLDAVTLALTLAELAG